MAAPNMGLQPLQLDKVAVSNGVVFFSLPSPTSLVQPGPELRRQPFVTGRPSRYIRHWIFSLHQKNLIEYKYRGTSLDQYQAHPWFVEPEGCCRLGFTAVGVISCWEKSVISHQVEVEDRLK